MVFFKVIYIFKYNKKLCMCEIEYVIKHMQVVLGNEP